MTLQVGDIVFVISSCESNTNGWRNAWVDEMDRYVNNGLSYTIASIHPDGSGIRFEEDPQYRFPPDSLSLVSEFDGVVITPVIRKIRAMERRRKELGYKW